MTNEEDKNKSEDKLEDLYDIKLNPENSLDKEEYKDIRDNNLVIEEQEVETPLYMKEIYNWAYVNPRNVRLLDRNFVVNFILFGNAKKLMNAYLSEIKSGDKVLQLTHVYGNLLPSIAKKIGDKGRLDATDVMEVQLEQARKKLKDFKNVNIWQQNAATAYHRDDYTIIGCFFLLHEVPRDLKIQIIDNILSMVEELDAKAVFVDYHNPVSYHPCRPILSLVNTFLEPFANDMWQHEIEDFAKDSENFNWEKTTYFGQVYQKVVVTKKK